MAHDRAGFTVVKWEGELRDGFSGGER